MFRCSILLSFAAVFLHAQNMLSIFFKVNEAELSTRAIHQLDSLVALRKPMVFSIYGNADSSGEQQANITLSRKRAEVVKSYLQNKMGNTIKISVTKGLGTSKPMTDNTTPELREKNRRTDIIIEPRNLSREKKNLPSKENLFSKKYNQIESKDTLSLPGLNFYGGRHYLLPEADVPLRKLVKMMKENPSLKIELRGHICCDYDNFDGEDIDTKTNNLSSNRAEYIKKLLEKNGILPNRILAIGVGSSDPLVYPEITDKDRTKNRRVDVVILSK